jgi:putative ABC transport system permease protein
VGVIDDIRQGAEQPARPEMYFPFAYAAPSESFLIVRMMAGLPAPVDEIRRELGRIDGDLAMANVRTLRALFESQGRVMAVVASIVDVLTVAIIGLAAFGLYGTLSFHFARRRRDIGIRLALGAAPKDIVQLVLKQAVVWVTAGLVFGTCGALLVSSVLRHVLQDANTFNVIGVALGAVVIFGVSLLAAWLPARRALRIDPVEALRSE